MDEEKERADSLEGKLVKEIQAHQQTQMILENVKRSEKTLEEQLRQAYVVIEALNRELRYRS